MGKLARESIRVSVIVSIGFVLGMITNMFIFPTIASKSDLGLYRYLLNWGTLFAQFLSLGVGAAAVRSYYEARHEEKLGELNALVLLLPTVATVVFTLVFVFISDFFLFKTSNDHTIDTWLMVLGILLFTVSLTYIKTYSGIAIVLKRSASLFFVSEILIRVLVLVVFVLYWYGTISKTAFVITLSFCYVIQFLAVLLIVRSYFVTYPFKFPAKKTTRPFLELSMFCLLDNSAGLLILQVDAIMIGAYMPNSYASIQEYSMALAMVAIVYMPWRPLGSTSIPYIAEAMKTSNLPSLKSIYQKSSLNLFIVGIMLFILIFTSIDPILSIIPDDYTNIKYAFLFLGIGKIIDMLTGVNANILSLSPYYKYNLYFNVVLIVIVFIANALLIPVFGITGSAMATAFCLLGINVLKCILVYKKYGIQPLHKNSWKVAVGMGVIFVAGMYMPVMFTKAIPEILMRGSILFLLMYVFLVWIKPSEDIEKMRINILRRIKLV